MRLRITKSALEIVCKLNSFIHTNWKRGGSSWKTLSGLRVWWEYYFMQTYSSIKIWMRQMYTPIKARKMERSCLNLQNVVIAVMYTLLFWSELTKNKFNFLLLRDFCFPRRCDRTQGNLSSTFQNAKCILIANIKIGFTVFQYHEGVKYGKMSACSLC